MTATTLRITLGAGALTLAAAPLWADQVIADDLIVQNSLCVGQDCNNGESFGFDTIRLKENNLRIRFQDTSNSASFPTRDWQLVANDSTNGGQNRFSIEDVDGARVPFTVEAGAPSHSLYVDDGGRIGLGRNTPVVELHVADGDSPTLRLEQDGTSGFTPQTWDVAGNETNFFVRDVTNGSKLPFKIRPGAADNTIYVNTDSNVGMGTSSPGATLHIRRTSGDAQVYVEEANASTSGRALIRLKNNGRPDIVMGNSAQAKEWSIGGGLDLIMKSGALDSSSGAKTTQFQISGTTGDATLNGTLTTGGGTCGGGCDLVFTPEYDLPSQADYADAMWTLGYLPNVGPTIENAPINVSDKLGRMLNALEHAHIFIDAQAEEIAALRAANAAQEARLQRLEERLVAD